MVRFLSVATLALLLLSPYAYTADESLILYLPLDEGAGDDVNDSSNSGNHGKKVGNANWVDGKIGGCIDFVAGSYVVVPNIPAYDVTDAVSLMAWVKTSSITTWARVIDRSQWQDNGFDLVLSMDTHTPAFEFFVNGTTTQAKSTTAVDDGQWHFIAGTFGNKKARIYVDGVMEREVASTGDVDIKPNDWPITLGVEANNLSGQPYTGLIDEVAIFNRELSADELADIQQNGIPVSSVVNSGGKLAATWGALKR
ncbi:LamG domain-containing protein [Candidatus Poribacteria bacterium]